MVQEKRGTANAHIRSKFFRFHATGSSLTAIDKSQWASAPGGYHGDGVGDVGHAQYSTYWHNFDNNCELFKQYQTGWFLHAWAMESTFDMVKDDGSYEIPSWKPRRC